MSKPNGYLFRGAAFSSEESAFEILVQSHEQELRFHETWEKEAKPYYFKDEQPRLSIPRKIAEELEELTGKTNWESTPYSVVEENGKINTWAYLGHGKCSEQLYKFCRDNTRLMHAYLNPLTRPFVEVEG